MIQVCVPFMTSILNSSQQLSISQICLFTSSNEAHLQKNSSCNITSKEILFQKSGLKNPFNIFVGQGFWSFNSLRVLPQNSHGLLK
ncbi:hypothetical protein pb186bvf_005372 [Paramecium bursaria]